MALHTRVKLTGSSLLYMDLEALTRPTSPNAYAIGPLRIFHIRFGWRGIVTTLLSIRSWAASNWFFALLGGNFVHHCNIPWRFSHILRIGSHRTALVVLENCQISNWRRVIFAIRLALSMVMRTWDRGACDIHRNLGENPNRSCIVVSRAASGAPLSKPLRKSPWRRLDFFFWMDYIEMISLVQCEVESANILPTSLGQFPGLFLLYSVGESC